MSVTQESPVYDMIIEKGREEGKRQTALNFLKNGVSIEIIARSTGLSKEEIESLRD